MDSRTEQRKGGGVRQRGEAEKRQRKAEMKQSSLAQFLVTPRPYNKLISLVKSLESWGLDSSMTLGASV